MRSLRSSEEDFKQLLPNEGMVVSEFHIPGSSPNSRCFKDLNPIERYYFLSHLPME